MGKLNENVTEMHREGQGGHVLCTFKNSTEFWEIVPVQEDKRADVWCLNTVSKGKASQNVAVG